MKAWKVDTNDSDYGATIVFAETSGKAKAVALANCSQFDGLDFTELCARRYKDLDQYYKGEAYPDAWNDDELRLILVRDYAWFCIDGIDSYCDDCIAKEYCLQWEGVEEEEW